MQLSCGILKSMQHVTTFSTAVDAIMGKYHRFLAGENVEVNDLTFDVSGFSPAELLVWDRISSPYDDMYADHGQECFDCRAHVAENIRSAMKNYERYVHGKLGRVLHIISAVYEKNVDGQKEGVTVSFVWHGKKLYAQYSSDVLLYIRKRVDIHGLHPDGNDMPAFPRTALGYDLILGSERKNILFESDANVALEDNDV